MPTSDLISQLPDCDPERNGSLSFRFCAVGDHVRAFKYSWDAPKREALQNLIDPIYFEAELHNQLREGIEPNSFHDLLLRVIFNADLQARNTLALRGSDIGQFLMADHHVENDRFEKALPWLEKAMKQNLHEVLPMVNGVWAECEAGLKESPKERDQKKVDQVSIVSSVNDEEIAAKRLPIFSLSMKNKMAVAG